MTNAPEQPTFAGNDEDDVPLIFLGDNLLSAVETVAETYCDCPPWFSTGLNELDRRIGGLHPCDLIVIAGRPSMGKTALALGIAVQVAGREAPPQQGDEQSTQGTGTQPLGYVAIFSPQMTAEQLGLRLCALAGKVSAYQLYKGEVDASNFGRVRDAAIYLQDARLHIDDRPAISIDQIAKRARRIKREMGLDLIVVDCLQQVVGPPWTRDNRTHELSEIVRVLKALAKELNVPVVAVSNLNRQVEDRPDRRPWLTDLRNSGEIEDIADLVLFVYRHYLYLEREEPAEGTPSHLQWQDDMDRVWKRADLILAKNRHGPTATMRLNFDSDTISFSSHSQDE